MHLYNLIVGFFQDGGLFMYPIAFILALGLAIAVERWIFLSEERSRNKKAWEGIMPVINDGNYGQARQLIDNSSAAIARILGYGLARSGSSSDRGDIELALEESLMEAMPPLERRTHYLATFANIATLLGLLGTIIGLIQAFTAVANVNPAEKADLLSASISVAMNTTAFGLMVAIPLLLLHAWLQTKTTELIDSLEMASVKFLNAVSEHGKKS